MSDQPFNELDIAIVGMAGRFPDADNVDVLWQNIRHGQSSVKTLTDDQLRAAGVSEEMLNHPDYVKATIPFGSMAQFDAEFFGFTPKEATQIDPQHRIFLQTCWHALEHAGLCEVKQFTGVFAGCGVPAYLMQNLLPQQTEQDITSLLALANGNDKDSLATRISYELDLTGPAVTVQTACSTSLVAVHMACRSLQNYECNAALAGGVWLNLFNEQGYLAPAGGSLSPSGQLSAFSDHADGILIGSGSAAVVLKRVDDAIEQGDHIFAVIKGSAINNDGHDKVGYTAPSVNGQAGAIQAALEFADIDPRTIGYIETHGTGTVLGDPIEIAALTQAYQSVDKQYCAIGSIKSNIGHLDAAAGVTGLIKAVQALCHQELPPSINCEPLNSKIDFANSPFYMPQQVQTWSMDERGDEPRRAAVSSLGMGGTNAHVILQEYLPVEQQTVSREVSWQLLPISAATVEGLAAQRRGLAEAITQAPEQLLTIAMQLQHKRRPLAAKQAFVVGDSQQALELLAREDLHGIATKKAPKVALLFSGQGSQYVTMSKPLLEQVPAYKVAFDEVLAKFSPQLRQELSTIFAPQDDQVLAANQLLNHTRITQPALFVVGYAMAKCYQAHGIEVSAMLGHSIGEYVAACLAGVFNLSDAVKLVSARGEALQQMAAGSMLSVMADESTVKPYLNPELDIAAFNSPTNTVIAGSKVAIKAVQAEFKAAGVSCARLHVSHAFHSYLTEPVLPQFEQALLEVTLQAPRSPFVSNVTGDWITAEQVTSTQYWLDQIRKPVNFVAGVKKIVETCSVLVEAGPGDTLQKLAQQCLEQCSNDVQVFNSIAHARDLKVAVPPFAYTLAGLWQLGVKLDWQQVSQPVQGQKMLAPLYCFAETDYWQAAALPAANPVDSVNNDVNKPELLAPVWQQQILTLSNDKTQVTGQRWLLLAADCDFLIGLEQQIKQLGVELITVWQGQQYAQLDSHSYRLDLTDASSLLQLKQHVGDIARVIDLRSVVENYINGFNQLLPVAQWAMNEKVSLSVIASGLFRVLGNETLAPLKSTLLGLTRAIGYEQTTAQIQLLEVCPSQANLQLPLVIEDLQNSSQKELAYRGKQRFVLSQQVIEVHSVVNHRPQVTLFTGGLGGVALCLAQSLARRGDKIVLLSRRAMPTETPDSIVQIAKLTQVELVQADVNDFASLQQAVAQAEAKVGTITQVVHAAGVAGGGLVSQQTIEQANQTMAAKLQGTDNLLKVFAEHSLTQMVFCSSIAAVLGAFGQSDYCAANVYLDTLANQHTSKFPVLSINWDAWASIGMAADQNLGLSANAGAEIFEQALMAGASGATQVYAAAMNWQVREAKLAELTAQLTNAATTSTVEQGKPRPALETEFEAPQSELEVKLAQLWIEVLGFTQVGVFDSFFELGGDSLMAIQMLAKAKQMFAIELEPAQFFEEPTIDNLSYLIEELLLQE